MQSHYFQAHQPVSGLESAAPKVRRRSCRAWCRHATRQPCTLGASDCRGGQSLPLSKGRKLSQNDSSSRVSLHNENLGLRSCRGSLPKGWLSRLNGYNLPITGSRNAALIVSTVTLTQCPNDEDWYGCLIECKPSVAEVT